MDSEAYICHTGRTICLKGSRSHRRGDYIYTDHYDITGDVNCHYKGLSYDASSSFDDSLSEGIAPYDVKNMKVFTPSFLSGFYADTADVASDVYRMEAKDIAVKETYQYIKKTARLGRVSLDNYQGDIERMLGTRVAAEDRAMFPVWFLSYRNKDRVAYATVNGQTGKVTADLPVSLFKYFLGSGILAIPIFILLNSSFTLRPKITLAIASFIALLVIVLYNSELKKIYIKDQKLDDKGRMYAGSATIRNESKDDQEKRNQKLAYDIADAIERGESKKSAFKGSLNERVNKSRSVSQIIFMIVTIICIAVPAFYTLQLTSILYGGSDLSFGTEFLVCIICLVAGVILAVSNHKTYKNIAGKKISGNIGSLIAMLIAVIILWLNPVSDIYYYVAVIAELAAIIYTITDLIRYYNVLATRKLPQFDNYRGGDDNA